MLAIPCAAQRAACRGSDTRSMFLSALMLPVAPDLPFLPFILKGPAPVYNPFQAAFENVCSPAFARKSSLRALVSVTRWYEQFNPAQVGQLQPFEAVVCITELLLGIDLRGRSS